MAERGGFEPPVARATLDFESSTFDRSDTSPKSWSALILADSKSRGLARDIKLNGGEGGINCGGCAILVARLEICHFMENCQSGSNPMVLTRFCQIFISSTTKVQNMKMAEKAGFEPAVTCDTHDFQSCTFGRSVTSPKSCSRAFEHGWLERSSSTARHNHRPEPHLSPAYDD